jgi:hypothetical protein
MGGGGKEAAWVLEQDCTGQATRCGFERVDRMPPATGIKSLNTVDLYTSAFRDFAHFIGLGVNLLLTQNLLFQI